jgi:beta-lactamase superfamily II metal-dependent hydrolase
LAEAGLFAICYLLFTALQSLPDGKLHVHFLDPERGEAILIETPDGQQVLPLARHFVIDCGYSPKELLSALGEHMPFYDREIELVVLTHPDDERIGGLVGLPERSKIGQVLLRSAPQAIPLRGAFAQRPEWAGTLSIPLGCLRELAESLAGAGCAHHCCRGWHASPPGLWHHPGRAAPGAGAGVGKGW